MPHHQSAAPRVEVGQREREEKPGRMAPCEIIEQSKKVDDPVGLIDHDVAAVDEELEGRRRLPQELAEDRQKGDSAGGYRTRGEPEVGLWQQNPGSPRRFRRLPASATRCRTKGKESARKRSCISC